MEACETLYRHEGSALKARMMSVTGICRWSRTSPEEGFVTCENKSQPCFCEYPDRGNRFQFWEAKVDPNHTAVMKQKRSVSKKLALSSLIDISVY
jgi:hypothetical protein